MDKRQIKIGNEHFKMWLKSLDPVARVERTSAIAKTQASAGLKGSMIRASLRQLSQRCVVMLIKLTDAEIKLLTRRKPVKRLEASVISNIPHDNQKQNKTSNSSKHFVDQSIKTGNKTKDLFSEFSLNSQNEVKHATKLQNEISEVKNQKKSDDGKHISTHLSRVPSTKFKKTFQKLFGDDYNDLSVIEKKFGEQTNSIENDNDRRVNNYLSTTVNVNIYNSTIFDCNEKDPVVVKRKSNSESTVLNSNSSASKRLRIDVSLSSKETPLNDTITIPPEEISGSDDMNAENPNKDRKSKKSRNSSKKRLKIKTNIAKPNKTTPSSLNSNGNFEDDPSIKELWSIFGMESPKDRSVTYNQTHPLEAQTITLHGVSDSSISESVVGDESHLTLSLQTAKKCLNQPTLLSERDCSENKNSTDEVCKEPDSIINEDIPSQEPEMFLKIANTYSLAEIPIPCDTIINASPPKLQVEDEKTKQFTIKKRLGNVTDTVNIEKNTVSTSMDEEHYPTEEDNTAKINTNNCTQRIENSGNRCKVGTIRVKNLGLLMNPQTPVDTSNNISRLGSTSSAGYPESKKTAMNDLQFNVQEINDTNREDTQRFDEQRFFNTYKHYFDELVESKIPKLGELLHLAVADGLRRTDRIKRAEQLSSDDLIKEEKQRAEKDFNDMMRIRGHEFSPLCEHILRRFDQFSKITLFNALFCRIMKHAEQIDPANKEYVEEAINVVQTMLSKHQFKDKEVSEFLQTGSQFKELMEEVSNLIDKLDNQGVNNQQNNVNAILQNKSAVNASTVFSPQSNINQVQLQNITDSINRTNSILRVKPAPSYPNNTPIFFSQDSNLRRNNLVSVRRLAGTTIAPNQSNTSTPHPLQLTRSGITLVRLPNSPRLSVQALSRPMPILQSSNRVGFSRPVHLQQMNQPVLASSLLTTIANASNVGNPSVASVSVIPNSSINTPVRNKPIFISSVFSQAHPSTISSSIRLQTPGKRPPVSEATTHLIIHRKDSNTSNIKKTHQPPILQEPPPRTSDSPSGTLKTTEASQSPVPATNSSISRNTATPTTVTLDKPATVIAESTSVSANLTLPSLLKNSAKADLPSSSHCHPFSRRMPISGKMKMFFGNANAKC
uniref:Uncharacterized protein n=1 Tax=Graphocephala atropunctata TaxID=36148 RepID=A0A1B6KI94_9HEMI